MSDATVRWQIDDHRSSFTIFFFLIIVKRPRQHASLVQNLVNRGPKIINESQAYIKRGVQFFRYFMSLMCKLGMAYRIIDISEKLIYCLFCKYQLSVSVKIISLKYRISAILKYRILVGRGGTNISDVGYRLREEYRISVKIIRYAIPSANQFLCCLLMHNKVHGQIAILVKICMCKQKEFGVSIRDRKYLNRCTSLFVICLCTKP